MLGELRFNFTLFGVLKECSVLPHGFVLGLGKALSEFMTLITAPTAGMLIKSRSVFRPDKGRVGSPSSLAYDPGVYARWNMWEGP